MFLDELPIGWIIPVYLLMIAGACLLVAGVWLLLQACEQKCCGEYTPPKVYTNSENRPQSTTRVEDPGCPLCGRYWCKCYRLSYP